MAEQRCSTTGKACLSHDIAEKRARNRRRLHGERVQAYHCRDCSWWHIGHSTRRPRLRRG